MCKFIIRHYWDEKSKSATVEPAWLTSGEELSSDKQAIKELYNKTLGDATYYIQLSKEKPKEESIDGYHIKYNYVSKDDPLNNNRKVTDITMCIDVPFRFLSMKILGILVVIILSIIWGMQYQSNKAISTEPEEVAKIIEKSKKNVIKSVVSKKNILAKKTFFICNEEWQEFEIRDDKAQTACLQDYFKYYCNNHTKLSLEKWLHSNASSINCIGIDKISYKKLTQKSRKKLKHKKKVFNFLKGK
jgi:hypothetical protein